jgi:hypothetical protein
MTTTITKTNNEKRVARPLKILVPLIKQKLRDGKAAAESAGMPYYVEAGAMLIEAKATNAEAVRPLSWGDWLNRNFHLSQQTANVYMRAAKLNGAIQFESLQEVRGDTRKFGHAPVWTEPVRDVLRDLKMETLNMRKHELSLDKEEKLSRTLVLQLIDIGYKVLAIKLHPDKGGSHEAMQRLNRVRATLRKSL